MPTLPDGVCPMTNEVPLDPVHVRGPLDLNIRKAIQAILYAANRLPPADMYCVLKALYFADKRHLHRYGRLIFGDRYVAMRLGPVPSAAYDIVKYVREGNPFLSCPEASEAFEVRDDRIIPYVDADTNAFSESDLECLDEAIEEVRSLSFSDLKFRSHDAAYESADPNDFMTIEALAALSPDKEILLPYIRDPYSHDA